MLGETLDDHVLFDSEPIIAWRAWRVSPVIRRKRESPHGTLHSTNFPMRWPTRKPMRAHCLIAYRAKDWQPHSCPELDHTCGIYAVNDRDRVNDWLPGRYPFAGAVAAPPGAFGTVALWGRVFRFEKGYRAEYAYPVAIVGGTVDEELLVEISERYGVPYIPEQAAA